MPEINGERLLKDLRRLAEFGKYRSGVHRPSFSRQDMDSRNWLAERYAEAGLEPFIDGVGNVFVRRSGLGAKLLVGSHSEAQNHAGWLDGALGVIHGVELARVFDFGIKPVAWSDEEGHFIAFLGSRSFIEDLRDEKIDEARDRDRPSR